MTMTSARMRFILYPRRHQLRLVFVNWLFKMVWKQPV